MNKSRRKLEKPTNLDPESAEEYQRLKSLVWGLSERLRDPRASLDEVQKIHDQAPRIAARIIELETADRVPDTTAHPLPESPDIPSSDDWRRDMITILMNPNTSTEELERIRAIIEQSNESGEV